MKQVKTPKNILIVNLGGIGDVLLSAPALRALKARYPASEIWMLVTTRGYKIAKRLPYVDKAVSFSLGYGGALSFGSIPRNLKTIFALRAERFDLAINMRTLVSRKSAGKTRLLFSIINPAVKAGRDTEGLGSFFDIKIPEAAFGGKYEMEYNIDTAEALGASVTDKSVDFKIDEKSRESFDKILEENGVSKDTCLIGVHPGGMPSHRWPKEFFCEAMHNINKKMPCIFVITGGKEEMALAESIIKDTGLDAINLAGRLDIVELGALIKRCNLFISNDTGPMHIAAVLKTPLVAIFGGGDIKRFDPRKISGKVKVLYTKADCAPCVLVECGDLRCLRSIAPAEVVQAALELIKDD